MGRESNESIISILDVFSKMNNSAGVDDTSRG